MDPGPSALLRIASSRGRLAADAQRIFFVLLVFLTADLPEREIDMAMDSLLFASRSSQWAAHVLIHTIWHNRGNLLYAAQPSEIGKPYPPFVWPLLDYVKD